MGPPCPPDWTYAGRAAYFGDRICGFCDRHNPAGAKFCNDCASPLHLKPCKRCDAINDQAAAYCHNCGAAFAGVHDPTPLPSPADATPAAPAPIQRSRRTAPLLWAAFATVIAGGYAASRIDVGSPGPPDAPDLPAVASQAPREPASIVAEADGDASLLAEAREAPTATAAATAADESTPAQPEPGAATAGKSPNALPPRAPATTVASPKSTGARQRPAPVNATKRASASAPPTHKPAAARAGTRLAGAHKPMQPDPSKVMHMSLAACAGDVIARMVCEQRVRRQFCEGRWGKAPHCATLVANDHGQ